MGENKGAQTAGIDKRTARVIEASAGGVEGFLEDLHAQVSARNFGLLSARQRKIPKAKGMRARWGCVLWPTV